MEESFQNYRAEFMEKFYFAPKLGNRTDAVLFRVGGVGFRSKTCIYSIMQGKDALTRTDIILNNLFPVKRGEKKESYLKDVKKGEKGVSPRMLKCTIYKGRSVQMGACQFAIE